jgi:gluconate kinase
MAGTAPIGDQRLDRRSRSTVLACSALKASFRLHLVEGLEDRVQFVYLKENLDLIERRLAG